MNIRFTRSVEERADDFAVHLLRDAGIDPVHFANALDNLRGETPEQLEKILRYIDTHPELDSRIRKAREFSEALDNHFTPIDIDWSELKETL